MTGTVSQRNAGVDVPGDCSVERLGLELPRRWRSSASATVPGRPAGDAECSRSRHADAVACNGGPMTAPSCARGAPRRSSVTAAMAPSTLGTFVRILHRRARPPTRPSPRDRLGAGVDRRGGSRTRAAGDRYRFLRARGARSSQAGRRLWLHGQLGYHPLMASRADAGEVLHIRTAQGGRPTPSAARCASSKNSFPASAAPVRSKADPVARATRGSGTRRIYAWLKKQGCTFSIGVEHPSPGCRSGSH